MNFSEVKLLKEKKSKGGSHDIHVSRPIPAQYPAAAICSHNPESRKDGSARKGTTQLRLRSFTDRQELSALTLTLRTIQHPGPSYKSKDKHQSKSFNEVQTIFAFLETGRFLPRSSGVYAEGLLLCLEVLVNH